MMATSALRTCRRNTTQTRATIRLTSMSCALERFDRAINQVRIGHRPIRWSRLEAGSVQSPRVDPLRFFVAARSLERHRNSLYDRQCSAQNRRRAPRLRAHFDSDHGTGRGGRSSRPGSTPARLSRLQRWPITAAFAVSAAIGRPRLRGKPKVRPARNSLTGRPSTRA